MSSVLELCAGLADQKIDSKKFGEILQIDEMPVWYFLDPFYLPRPFRDWSKIDEIIAQERAPSGLGNFKTSVISSVKRREMITNEKLRFRKLKKVDKIKPGKKDILFVSSTDQVFEKSGKFDFFGFGDVMRDLEKKRVKPLVMVYDPLSRPFFKYREYPGAPDYLAPLYAYVDDEIIKESKSLSQKLNREWKNIDKSKLFTFRGKNYWEYLKNEMNFVFSKEMLFVTLVYYKTFQKIIKTHDIKGVYVAGWGIHELAIWAAARKLGKWTVYSQHGYGYYPHSLVGTRIYSKFADVIFLAAGKERAETYVKWGIKCKNVFITGSPFLDKIAGYKPGKGAGKGGKTVTFLSTAIVEYKFAEKTEFFNHVRRYLKQISKAKNVKKVIIKMRQDEKYRSEYESVIKSLKLTNVEIEQRPQKEVLYSILRDSDLMISFGSTVDLEALILGKNVIIIEGFFGADYRKVPYKQAVVQVEKDDDLTGTVEKVLNDKKVQRDLKQKRERYVKEAFFKVDGKAHERVADLVFKLIKVASYGV